MRGEVLAHDRAGAQVEVTDLGVAHLPLGQPDGAPGGGERGVGVGGPQLVEHGSVGERDRVAGTRLGETPAVQHDETGARHAQEAACTIAANESASSEAPPTSAPSTSGRASSAGAFSGLTEPP